MLLSSRAEAARLLLITSLEDHVQPRATEGIRESLLDAETDYGLTSLLEVPVDGVGTSEAAGDDGSKSSGGGGPELQGGVPRADDAKASTLEVGSACRLASGQGRGRLACSQGRSRSKSSNGENDEG